MKNKGFTLIELLVVVAIIGILATVVLASLGQARTRARVAKAQAEMQQIKTLITGAQINRSARLGVITGRYGSGDSCSGDLSDLVSTDNCVEYWEQAIDRIVAGYEGVDQSSSSGLGSDFYTDPWGTPYVLHENEGRTVGSPCQVNTLMSVGPDQNIGGVDNIVFITPYESCS